MKRGAPMKRVPMSRGTPKGYDRPERVKPVHAPLTRKVHYGAPADDVQAQPKRDYVRCEALLIACRQLPCQHCRRAEPGTVCAAHSNWYDWGGKGGHIKADDNCVAALCDLCHVPVLDQGSKLSRAERRAMWLAAHLATVLELQRRGLWPDGVPIPDLSTT